MKNVCCLVGLACLVVIGCQNPLSMDRDSGVTTNVLARTAAVGATGSATVVVDLVARKGTVVGTVTVSNDNDTLRVEYAVDEPWALTETHLAVAISLEDIPQKNDGDPIPAQFPYVQTHDAAQSYTYEIDLSKFDGCGCGSLLIAAHAEVRLIKNGHETKKERVWATGEDFPGHSSATYFGYVAERVWKGGFSIRNVGDLAGYTRVTGRLSIINTDLANLEWLQCLTSIGGDLSIFVNNTLTSLTGLEGLTSIGGDFWIFHNRALTNLTGLEGLTSIGGYLSMEENTLTSLTGLEGLTSIGGKLRIDSNPTLTSLSGLEGLTSIGGDFWIGFNRLTNLTGLEGLTSIGGIFGIVFEEALTSLTGLEGLTSIGGGLGIHRNWALTSLTGLEGLTSVGDYLRITSNTALPTSLAWEFVIALGFTGPVTIEGNGP